MRTAAPASEEARSWPRRHRRLLVVAGAALVLVLAGLVALSWHYSSVVLAPDRSGRSPDVTVERVGSERVVLSRSEEAARPGVYGLEWPGGHAIVGEVVAGDAGTVTRRLRAVRGHLAPGRSVALDARVYAGNPEQALGLPFAAVPVRGELGPMPAWSIPGRTRDWAIVVHGLDGDRRAGLRIAPVLRRAGLPTLLISYRNDPGAPPSPDGLHHLGLTEWRDLEAAARHALAHGARRLVLVGYSMGGAIVTQFMQRSSLAGRVAGLVLDAPALDWRSILSHHASEMGLPSFAALPVRWAIGARIDADWDSLDARRHADALGLPVLLFHGTGDGLVPISTSDALAEELPRRVTYHRVPEAGHVGSWNVDPEAYERRLAAFLDRIGARRPGGDGAPSVLREIGPAFSDASRPPRAGGSRGSRPRSRARRSRGTAAPRRAGRARRP